MTIIIDGTTGVPVSPVTGTLAVGNGGTGASTFTDGGLLIGKGTGAFETTGVLADGAIVVGDGTTNPTTLAAFTGGTGTLKHERGGIEADISAITTDQFLVGQSAGVIAVRTATQTRAHLGLGTAAIVNTGTSGATIPLLDGNNTHSGGLTLSGQFVVNNGLFYLNDTSNNDALRLVLNENLSASRILNLTVGNGTRALAITGDATISQDYSTTGTPQFARLGVNKASTTSGLIDASVSSGTITNAVIVAAYTGTNRVGRQVYYGVTDDQASAILYGVANHATHDYPMTYMQSARAANSGYTFFTGASGGGADTEVILRGDGTVLSDIAATTPADIAWMREWADGNPTSEDRRGWSVVLLADGTIRRALVGERVYGVVKDPTNCAMIVNSHWSRWKDAYLRDRFGAIILEDYDVWEFDTEEEYQAEVEFEVMVSTAVNSGEIDPETNLPIYVNELRPQQMKRFETRTRTVRKAINAEDVPEDTPTPNKTVSTQQRRKENPLWNPEAEYIPRVNRKEWDAVGVLGRCETLVGEVTMPGWWKEREAVDGVEVYFIFPQAA